MKYGPGKFEACGNHSLVARWLYDTSDGGNGSVDELGWWDTFAGRIKGRGPFFAIVTEDSQGFVEVEWLDSQKDLDKRVSEIEEDYEKFYEESEQAGF